MNFWTFLDRNFFWLAVIFVFCVSVESTGNVCHVRIGDSPSPSASASK